MLDAITIELAGEPRGKGRPRFVRATGRAYTPADTARYESHLRLAAQDAMAGRPPLEGPLRVAIVARLPIPESWSRKKRDQARLGMLMPTVKPDADNLVKMIDALNEIVWRDDKQAVDVHVRKVYSDRPALVITVEPAAAAGSLFAQAAE